MAAETVCRGVGRGIASPVFDPSSHRLFVASSGSGAVLVHDAESESLVEFASTAGQPAAVAFDPAGQMVVADHAHAAVLVLHEDGSQQTVVNEYEGEPFKGPSAVAFDESGSMYFTDGGPLGETSLAAPTGSVFQVTTAGGKSILRPLLLRCLANPTGIALSPDGACVYVAEMMTNRILRLVQRPAGIFHASVFFQFSGGVGPSAIVCDRDRRGILYVARFDVKECSDRGLVSVLSPEGSHLKDIEVPGAEVSGLALSPDGDALFVTEASASAIYRVPL